MNATRAEITKQYNRAKKLLWTEHFREASNTITPNLFDTADLMAIGSRETNLDPKWLTQAGDHGNGFGLMQADKRSFPEFTRGDGWKDARTGILFGAKVLKQKWDDVQGNAGKRLSVSDRKGNRYTFTGPHVSGLIAQQIAIAGYNSGRWAAYHYTKGRNPDYGTTGKDYSSDVMARARVFRELLGKDGMLDSAATPASSQEIIEQNSKLPLDTANQAAADNPQNIPVPLVAIPQPVIEVPQISPVPEEPKPETKEDPVVSIGNKVSAIWTAIGATLVAVATFLTSTPLGIAISIVGAIALIGIVYMAVNAIRNNAKERRDHEAKLEREKADAALKAEREARAFELQKLTLQSAMRQDLNAVTIAAPPSTEMANSDSPPNGGNV